MLLNAAKAGDLESVKALVQGGEDVNAKNEYGYTALMRAAGGDHVDVMRYLVGQGLDLNAPNDDGNTALIRADRGDHVDVVRYLVEQGADVNARSKYGCTVLMAASKSGKMDIVKFILDRGANANAVDTNGKTAVYFAAKAGHAHIQRLLTSRLHVAPSAAYLSLDVLKDQKSPVSTRWLISPFEVDLKTRIDREVIGVQFRAKWLDADVVVKLFIPGASVALFVEEVTVWRQLRHPNVIKLYDACNVGHYFFVSEFASKGSVVEYLAACRRTGGECTPWTFLHGAALGLAYLHKRNIVHGDLRGSNILIGSDGLAKLSEFSVSGSAGGSVESGMFGSTRWQSPERVRGGEASFASDVYSLGLCIVEVLSGKVPWETWEESDSLNVMKRNWNTASNACSYFAPGPLTDDAADLVSRMCALNPTKRVTVSVAAQVLERLAAQERSKRQTTQQPEPEPDWSIDEYNMLVGLTDLWTRTQKAVRTYAGNDFHRSMLDEVQAVYEQLGTSDRPKKLLDQFHQLLVDMEAMMRPDSLQNRIQRLSATRATGFMMSGLRDRLDGIWSLVKGSLSEFELYKQRWHEQQPDNPEMFISEEDQTLLVFKEPKAKEDWAVFRKMLKSEIDDHRDDYTSDQLSVIKKVYNDLVEHNMSEVVTTTPEWFLPWYELDVDKMSCVGVGGFGGVYRARWLESEVVVKLLDQGNGPHEGNDDSTWYSTYSTSSITTETSDDPDKKQQRKKFEHEVNVWFGLSHPHIVRLFGACHIGTLFFACEYASQGSLDEYLREHPDDLWQKLYEAALGVQYLHARGVIHGDLKCNNILVGGDGKAKVTDFGLSSDTAELENANPQVTGAWHWVAPECLEHGASELSVASDVYSLGMCIVEALRVVEMMTLNLDQSAHSWLPWGNLPNIAVKGHVVKLKELPRRPQICTDDEWRLVARMCRNDPSERLKISTVVDELERLARAKTSADKKEKKTPSMVEVTSETGDLVGCPRDVISAPTAAVAVGSSHLEQIPVVIESMQAYSCSKDGNSNVLNQILGLLWERMAHLLCVISDKDDDVESLRELVERAKQITMALPEVKNTLVEFTEAAMRGYALHRDVDKLMDAKFWRGASSEDDVHKWQRHCSEFLGVANEVINL